MTDIGPGSWVQAIDSVRVPHATPEISITAGAIYQIEEVGPLTWRHCRGRDGVTLVGQPDARHVFSPLQRQVWCICHFRPWPPADDEIALADEQIPVPA